MAQRHRFGALCLVVFGLACATEQSDDERRASEDTSESSGSGSPGGSHSAGYVCCINNTNYACPDKAAFDRCSGFDIDGCMNACAFDDFDCTDACFEQWGSATTDPSACTEDANVSCDGSAGGGNAGGGACVGEWNGQYCDGDADCESSNCTDDKCYGNDDGNPCEGDADCTSSNCTEGCCHGNAPGDRCEGDADCVSSNCYEGVCQ